MALVYAEIVEKCGLAKSCDVVSICLGPEWAGRTTNGIALIEARVIRVSKFVSPYTEPPSCCADPKTICVEECIYHLEINNNQFKQNPSTTKPYDLGCGDLLSLTPFSCHISRLIDAINCDWIIDSASACEGIGSSNMVRSINVDGCTLTIRSAPEHTNVIIGAFMGGVAGLTATTTGIYCETRGSLVINNPSTCRTSQGFVRTAAIGLVNQGNGDRVLLRLNGAITAPPAVDLVTDGNTLFQATGADNTVRYEKKELIREQYNVGMGPGGSTTFHQVFSYSIPYISSSGVIFGGTYQSLQLQLFTM